MPARPQGVYQDKRGKWYFKVTVGHDPLTGKRDQITRRGFANMAEAARERREVLARSTGADRSVFLPDSRSMSCSTSTSTASTPIRGSPLRPASTTGSTRRITSGRISAITGSGTSLPRSSWPGNANSSRRAVPSARKARMASLVPGEAAVAANTVNRVRAPLSGAFKLAVLSRDDSDQPPRADPSAQAPTQNPEVLVTRGGPQVPRL